MRPQDRYTTRETGPPVRYGADITDSHTLLRYRVSVYGIDADGRKVHLRGRRVCWTYGGALTYAVDALRYLGAGALVLTGSWRIEAA